jgi:hypothetical protein
MTAAIEYDATPVNVRGEPLSEIWWQGRQWAVTSHGIERRDGLYNFAASRLRENHATPNPYSWIAHMGEKGWCDMEDFATAYFVGCAMHGHKLPRKEVAMLEKHFRKAHALASAEARQ